MTDMAGNPKILGLPTLVNNLNGRIFLLNQRVGKLMDFSSEIYIPFLKYYLSSPIVKEYYKSKGAGGLQLNISKKDILEVNIPIPPHEQQRQIVEILDKTFESIEKAKENIKKNIQNSKELFASRLNEIFSQKGDGWEEKDLGELAEFRNGLNFSNSDKGESFKIVSVASFKNNFSVNIESLDNITISGNLKDIDKLEEGDILAVRSNGNPNLIGRCMIVNEIVEKVSFSGFTIRIRLLDDNIYPIYLNYFLKSNDTRNKLIKSGNGTNIRNLNQKSLSSLNFVYPTERKEQIKIVDEINTLSKNTKQLEKQYQQKLNNLEELKKSILEKAFSGELLK